uniref:RZ-type domain-containing protein n=1 Tax=Panagrolaimus sp. PS1159 TaxID=55785 RepID=A0AC35FDZ6_9BILA
MSEQKITNFWEDLKKELIYLIGRIDPRNISETTVQQIAYETQRFGFLVEFFSYLARAANTVNNNSNNNLQQNALGMIFSYLTRTPSNSNDINQDVADLINQIFEKLNGSKDFDENLEKELSEKLTTLSKLHPVSNFDVSEKERIEIVKALGSHVTRWYKCPNGHIYGIGNCGGAVVTSQCPECKATIGGELHRLRNDNQDAQAEMLQGTGETAQPWMATKNVRYSFIEQNFTTSENRNYNLNLNQSEKCPELIPVQSNSKPNNDKNCEKEKSQSWNKFFKISTSTTLNENKKRWKSEKTLNTTNKSTPSLHIAAYENSPEAAVSDLFDDKNIKGLKKEKFGSIKTSDSLKSRNPFEFLRQQSGDQRNEPEVMKFEASQKCASG